MELDNMGINFENIEFPCGLRIETTMKSLFKNIKEIKCPIHGKSCKNTSLRQIEDMSKK